MQEDSSLYSIVEEKYYSIVDKIGFLQPIVSRIDKVFPSFLLLLILAIVIIAGVSIPLLLKNNETVLELRLIDEVGNPVAGNLEISFSGKSFLAQSDSIGIAKKAVPFDSNVLFLASAKGYLATEGTVFVGKELVSRTVVLEKEQKSFDRKVIFSLESGERILGKIITAKLSCSNSAVKVLPEIVSSNKEAEIEFTEPANCGTLSLEVNSPAEFLQKKTEITEPLTVVALEFEQFAKATVELKAVDENGMLLEFFDGTVTFFSNGSMVQNFQLSQGNGIFEIIPGNFEVLAADNTGQFAMLEKVFLDLNSGQKSLLEIKMTKELSGSAKGIVLDKNSGKPIANATVELKDLEGKIIAFSSSAENGEFSLPLAKGLFLELVVSSQGYLPFLETIDFGIGQKKVFLEKATEFNSAKANVFVFDSENNPAENAVVSLFFSDTMEAAPYGTQVTDSNGAAFFSGIKTGKYVAVAEKYPKKGQSVELETSILGENSFFVWFDAVEEFFFLEALDEQGNRIIGTTVDVFDAADGRKISSIELADGSGFFSNNSGERVFFVFRNTDYLPYFSEVFNPMVAGFSEVKAVLRKNISSNAPFAELEGIFNEFGERVLDLDFGKTYFARLALVVPREGFETAKLHFRTGSSNSIESDELQIAGANTGIAELFYGKEYNPPFLEQSDFSAKNTASFPAKWIEATVKNPEAGVYSVVAKLNVLQETKYNSPLPLFYRSDGVQNGAHYRSPEDRQLGQAASTGQKQELYAETIFSGEFFKREERTCYGDICFSVNILDANNNIFLKEPFELYNGNSYKLLFSIINGGKKQLEKISFTAGAIGSKKEKAWKIDGFDLETEKKTFAENATGTVPIESIGIGKKLSGSVGISPIEEGYSSIRFSFSQQDRNNVFFDYYFGVSEKKLMEIKAIPQKPVALAQNSILLHATDIDNGKGIPNTLFKIIIFGSDYSECMIEKKSDSNGFAKFLLPSMKPGSVLWIEAFSSEYYSKPFALEVGNAPLFFSIDPAVVSINSNESIEKYASIGISNSTGETLRLETVELFFEQPAFFDLQAMNLALKKFPKEFAAFSEKENAPLLIKLKKNVFFQKNSRYNAALLIKANSNSGKWVFSLPFKIIVDENEFSQTNNCIALSEDEWKADLQKNLFSKTITMKNNCAIGNDSISAYDLSAVAEWGLEKMGNIEIALLDSDGKEETAIPVQEKNSQIFLQELIPETKQKAIIRFFPKNGFLGKTAEFGIKINAISPGKKKNTIISTDKIVEAKILLFNPVSCVRIIPTGQKIKILEKDRNASFFVDASQCGGQKMFFTLCENNQYCNGDGEENIQATPDSFILTKSEQTKKIQLIRPQVPGEYNVNLSVRVADVVFENFAEILVEVEPEKTTQLVLNKYSFFLGNKNEMDSAKITNRQLAETVKIEASVCSLQEIMQDEKKLFNFGTAGGGLLAAEFSGSAQTFRKAIATSSAMAKADANTIISALEAARNAFEKAKKAEEAAQKVVDETQKALELSQTLTSSIGIVQTAISVSQMLNQTSVEGACNNFGKEARTQLATVSITATALGIGLGLVQTQLGDMLSEINSGYGIANNSEIKAESMKENAENGKKEMIPADASEIPFANATASQSFNSARMYGKEAATNNFNSEQKFSKAEGMAETVIAENLAKCEAQGHLVFNTNQAYFAYLKLAIAPCEDNPYCNWGKCSAAYAMAKTYSDTAVTAQLVQILAQEATLTASVIKAKNLSKDAIVALKEARDAIIEAVIKLRWAVIETQSLSDAVAKTSELQSKKTGLIDSMISLYPLLGFSNGMEEAGTYSEMDNPCEQTIKAKTSGYITNLFDDVKSISINTDDVSVSLNKEAVKSSGDYNSQSAGIVLQSNGFSGEKPVFGTVTVHYNQHLHDSVQEVPLNFKSLAVFNVPSSETISAVQKYHVRIIPSPEETVVLPEKETVSCLQGIRSGSTGSGALPRIKLDWGWSEEKGILEDTCVESNENYFYCDATQFNILLSKRLNSLDEWLSLNNGKLNCPVNKVEQKAVLMVEKLSSRTVGENSMGIEKILAAVKGNNATVSVLVTNNSEEEKKANIAFSIVPPKGILLEEVNCFKQQTVNATDSAIIRCDFEGLPDSKQYYSFKAVLRPNDSIETTEEGIVFNDENFIDLNGSLSVSFRTNQDSLKKDCWLEKTTDFFDDKSALEYFAQDSKPFWTLKVKNLKDLSKLLHFNAYLIQENYNKDFLRDFGGFYSNTRFFDTPTFFNDATIQKTLNKYYSQGRLSFSNGFFDSTMLSGAGLFSIDINSSFNNSWALFNGEKEPNASINVVLSKIAEPFPSSPFYYIPFESEVGLNGTVLERKGYGTAYNVVGKNISLNDSEYDKLLGGINHGALIIANAVFQQDIEKINSDALTRGNILSISIPAGRDGNSEIVFSPNYASNAILKISAEKGIGKPVVYQLLKNLKATDAGNSLAYCTGMDNCNGFNGAPLKQDFDFSSDRKASAKDWTLEWNKSYAIETGTIEKPGTILLKTIIFTPLEGAFLLKTISPNLKVAGIEKEFGENIELNGIKGMVFNSKTSENYAKTIKDAFSLVENNSACISNNGLQTSIWWNTVMLEKQKQNNNSIETIEKAIIAGKDCIGK